jgi:glycopeptide antibiotics resistance protein
MNGLSINFESLPLVLGLIILAVFMIILHRKKRSVGFLVCFALFGLYILLVIKFTLFPINIVPENAIRFKEQGITILSHGNMRPFIFGQFATAKYIFWFVSQNIILTMPFGFGINFLVGNKRGKLVWLTLIGGLGIEFSQWLISTILGYPYRVVDVNDAISNATGVVLGYICFMLFARIYVRKAEQNSNLRIGQLASYIYSVTRAALVGLKDKII